MSTHLYTIGQHVEFIAGRFDGNVPRGLYTVVRQLPGPANDREYRVKHQKDGHERIVLESQLRVGPPALFG
ncbi:hypothetical protein ACFQY5_06815 [Paeniroseomonas aquatica]|uniref:Uncharacterized protein n=1 Tax=Paeniroseomonas aquatica TaxID=373043 RepID=A0ABT8AC59_9PROT|nr:hypothetical protein [Paeniroseomonas aquatica]MDN3566924.1 hypothetical protein [Paeniroseomonas aquatica]